MFELWKKLHHAPHHLPMEKGVWENSMYADVDSDGRQLFTKLNTEASENAMVQYGYSAFGFDENGEISADIHYPIIRDLAFEPEHRVEAEAMLKKVLEYFKGEARIYAFFHYFGMSACGRHGKLHEKDRHIAQLLEENGFVVEHENVYYTRQLTENDAGDERIQLQWRERSAGACREFAASLEDQEICWGQVHFLPQGDIAYLRWIFLDSNRQHTGLGTAVMKQLFKQLYDMGIRQFDTDTALSNTAAQGYYEKTGFTNAGITRSYYTK
jgi:ribosomal protein S18 acetylase RimI-like enzyme